MNLCTAFCRQEHSHASGRMATLCFQAIAPNDGAGDFVAERIGIRQLIRAIDNQWDTQAVQGTSFFFFWRVFALAIGRPGEFDGSDDSEIGIANDEINATTSHFGQAKTFLTTTQLSQLSNADL